MAIKRVEYKEPSSYFNADMKKAVAKWEKEQKAKEQKTTPSKKK